jgi:hypothetical protein
MVDFPDALRPVNQIVKPRCLRKVLRSLRERDGCQVILLECELASRSSCHMAGRRGTYVAIVK